MEQGLNIKDSVIRQKRLEILSKMSRGIALGSEELKGIPEELLSDKQFVLSMVQNNGINLHYASESLKDDREVVIAACFQFPGAIESASDTLRKDENFIIALGKEIDFTKFSNNYKAGQQGISCWLSEVGFNVADANRIALIINKNKAN